MEGPEWSTAAGREGADLWRRIWARASSLNAEGEEVKAKKVKGHATSEDVHANRVRATDVKMPTNIHIA